MILLILCCWPWPEGESISSIHQNHGDETAYLINGFDLLAAVCSMAFVCLPSKKMTHNLSKEFRIVAPALFQTSREKRCLRLSYIQYGGHLEMSGTYRTYDTYFIVAHTRIISRNNMVYPVSIVCTYI